MLLYLLWWTTYAGIHFEQRFTQQPPGAAGRGRRHDDPAAVADPVRGYWPTRSTAAPPKVADPGAVWVVAVLEAMQQPGAPEFFCTVELVGPHGRRWEPQVYVTGRCPTAPATE